MIDTSKLDVIILSGGSGSRFCSETPKTFITVKNRVLILYPIFAFASMSFVDNIVLVVGDSCPLELIKDNPIMKKIHIVRGGKQRPDSVYAGLNELSKISQHSKYVAIHDGARPFVPESVVANAFDLCKKIGASAPGLPVTDTIKEIDDNHNISKHLKRANLVGIQTPQIFEFNKIFDIYQSQNEMMTVTDDTQLINGEVGIVEGSRDLMKLTYPEDLLLAEKIAEKYEFLF